MENRPSSSMATPIAIVVGFGLIAGAIFFSDFGRSPNTAEAPSVSDTPAVTSTIKPVSDTDFIKGNPNAPIMIVEYSDYDCPFCQVFHSTMNQLMTEYALTGKVAWVYRQMPIAQLHPNAPKISEAALCVGEIGGNDAFWKFSDAVFTSRQQNEQTNISLLPDFAVQAGVNKAAFNDCYQTGKKATAVEAAVKDGFASGVTGTPHSVIIVGDQQAVIEGAQPYAAVKQIIESLIGQLEGTAPEATPAEE